MRGPHFQEIIQLISGLSFRSTCAPDLRVNRCQANLVRRLIPMAATDADGAIDQRQLMVFLKEDHQSVGQLDPLWLLRVKLVQWWNRNLLPRSRRCA